MSLALIIQNDGTGTPDTGHYDWRIQINGKVLRRGRLEDYPRALGHEGLIRMIAGRLSWRPYPDTEDGTPPEDYLKAMELWACRNCGSHTPHPYLDRRDVPHCPVCDGIRLRLTHLVQIIETYEEDPYG